jgi:Txe/YoeB family toxin of Txe-Axe toxin-antitoxin module
LKKFEEIVLNVEKNYYTGIQKPENLQDVVDILSVSL